MKLDHLATEQRNDRTKKLDEMSAAAILQAMNEEDRTVADAVYRVLPVLTDVVKQITERMKQGGRLIYIGAGTSGRLGVLDAVECPPTFGTAEGQVIGLIAGGQQAFLKAVEGAEDSEVLAAAELEEHRLTPLDTVIGIAASGRTPYVIHALRYAKKQGAFTVSIACNEEALISREADECVEIATGTEILTGSTRLKAGTAQKMVLNMISTAVMIGLGKVYENLMVDVQPTNRKLEHRSVSIIAQATGVTNEEAEQLYEKADRHVKTAIVMALTGESKQRATARLNEAGGFVKQAIRL